VTTQYVIQSGRIRNASITYSTAVAVAARTTGTCILYMYMYAIPAIGDYGKPRTKKHAT